MASVLRNLSWFKLMYNSLRFPNIHYCSDYSNKYLHNKPGVILKFRLSFRNHFRTLYGSVTCLELLARTLVLITCSKKKCFSVSNLFTSLISETEQLFKRSIYPLDINAPVIVIALWYFFHSVIPHA